MIFFGKIILSKSNLCAKRTNSKNFTLNSFTGYLSPRKNFTSLEYQIIIIVLKTCTKTFFQNVLHFNEENASSFTLSDEELLFGKSLNTIDQLQRSPLLKKLNYCMLLAKYYLYNQKRNQIEPELKEFKNRLNLQYRVEKLV